MSNFHFNDQFYHDYTLGVQFTLDNVSGYSFTIPVPKNVYPHMINRSNQVHSLHANTLREALTNVIEQGKYKESFPDLEASDIANSDGFLVQRTWLQRENHSSFPKKLIKYIELGV